MGGLITSTRSSIATFSAGCFDRMDSQSDADKQTNPVVSPSLLQWDMKDVRDFNDPNFNLCKILSGSLHSLKGKVILSVNKGKED